MARQVFEMETVQLLEMEDKQVFEMEAVQLLEMEDRQVFQKYDKCSVQFLEVVFVWFYDTEAR